VATATALVEEEVVVVVLVAAEVVMMMMGGIMMMMMAVADGRQRLDRSKTRGSGSLAWSRANRVVEG